MTKQEFVDAVAGKSGLSKRDAGAAVDAFLETVEETLKAGTPLQIRNDGTDEAMLFIVGAPPQQGGIDTYPDVED